MFRAAKDAIAGKSARVYLNDLLARYGELQQLRIDSKAGKMEMVILLHGEAIPLKVVTRYALESKGGERSLRLEDCQCERAWVKNLLKDFAEGKSFPIPGWAAAALA